MPKTLSQFIAEKRKEFEKKFLRMMSIEAEMKCELWIATSLTELAHDMAESVKLEKITDEQRDAMEKCELYDGIQIGANKAIDDLAERIKTFIES